MEASKVLAIVSVALMLLAIERRLEYIEGHLRIIASPPAKTSTFDRQLLEDEIRWRKHAWKR